ncbi:uncharacterized protein V1516DRAFT_612836, partial [Lipomyces oligophaga]|uniref:uncharacterized protein n=1 Tax=Lipomyces oligophaga TaxID=45792 RepID=UPI0034CF75A8
DAQTQLIVLTEYIGQHFVRLGLADDSSLPYRVRLLFWRLLNRAWLDLIATMHGQPEQLQRIGSLVVSVSDRLELYGLVDYELGFWEE